MEIHYGTIETEHSNHPVIYSYNAYMGEICINGLNISEGASHIIGILPKDARPKADKSIDVSGPEGAYVRILILVSGSIYAHKYNDVNAENVMLSFAYIK